MRPEGANHQCGKIPPGELSIDPEAGERLGRVTGRVGASLQRSPLGRLSDPNVSEARAASVNADFDLVLLLF